jgi:hypothetical protein
MQLQIFQPSVRDRSTTQKKGLVFASLVPPHLLIRAVRSDLFVLFDLVVPGA